MKPITTQEVKQFIRQPYVWPGGYEVVFIADDGEVICHNCARENWQQICSSMTNAINDGWRIIDNAAIGVDIESTEDSPLYCAHCNKTWEA